MRVAKLLFVIIAVILTFPAPVQAGQWYIGGGLNNVNLGKDLGDIDSDQGLTFNFGYYFQPSLALDFVLGFSDHVDTDGDTLTYTRLDIGAGFAFGTGIGLSPYLVVGLGSHNLEYDNYFDAFTGTSLFLGGGFDYYITPGHSVDFGLRVHAWDIDLESGGFKFLNVGDATTTVLSVMYNYHFIM